MTQMLVRQGCGKLKRGQFLFLYIIIIIFTLFYVEFQINTWDRVFYVKKVTHVNVIQKAHANIIIYSLAYCKGPSIYST